MKKQHGIKSGFTLIELLVVVTILGLLAIVVLPALTAGGDKRLLRGAAERLDTHLKHAAARATGKPRGSAVWLEADADAGTGTPVFDLNFARMPTGTPSQGTVRPGIPGPNFATVSPSNSVSCETWSLIHFDMNTAEFKLSAQAGPDLIIKFADGQNRFNSAFPNSPNTLIEFTVYEPPSGPLITSRPTVMPARVCVDLESSTIGVNLFGDYKNNDDDSPELLSTYDRLAICFDVYGKPNEIWGWSGSTATPIPLTPGKPIALLCTLAYQSGQLQASYPTTESNPGAGWQNPDAFWVVIDPKTGRNIIVQNYFEPTSLQQAQTFIKNDLLAQ